MMSIGERLAQLRRRNGYTLHTLHELTGISLSYLSAIEKGQRPNPSFRTVERLASVFHVPLEYFSTRDDNPEAILLAKRIQELYDKETQEFLVSESSRPYLTLVQQLAKQQFVEDEPDLLQTIAQFIRDRKQPYHK